MSDIWHTADEIPPEDSYVVVKLHSGKCEVGFEFEYDFDNIEKLAFFDDLLALENELERTRKALEIAVDALKEYADRDNWGFGFAPWIEDGFNDALYTEYGYKTAQQALEQITALEQKDVK